MSEDWNISGRRCEFKILPKKLIEVDTTYQRDFHEKKIKNLAKDWDSSLAGTILVAYRAPDRKYYVIDGQHRLRASMLRNDVTHLNCIVTTTNSVIEEADLFIKCNSMRTTLSPYQMFKAKLANDDEDAIFVRDCANKYNICITSGKVINQPKCRAYSTMLSIVSKEGGREILSECLSLLSESTADGENIPQELIQGLSTILEKYYIPDYNKFRSKFISIGTSKIKVKAKMLSMQLGNHGFAYSVYLAAIVDEINKGVRYEENKIKPKELGV